MAPENFFIAPNLAQFPWLAHGFGTRHYQPPDSLITLSQIHSARAIHVDRPDCPPEGDALLSSTPGRIVGVRTADCVPILLVDEVHRAVAAVHAGWRGSVSLIVREAIDAMSARWSTRPEQLHAAIGPAIGACCYKVDSDVASQFIELFPERHDLGRRTSIDLVEANRRQLLAAGVNPRRILATGLCTSCNPDRFYSFRRDREAAGRMVSFIGVKAAPPSPDGTSVETGRSS